MSRCIFHHLKNYGKHHKITSFRAKSFQFLLKSQEHHQCRSFCKDKGDKSETIGQTTILVQRGCDIQELPCILKKLDKDEFVTICANKSNNIDNDGFQKNSESEVSKTTPATTVGINNEGIIVLIDNCMTSTGILSIINEIPKGCLHPEVATHAFDRLIRNETLIGLKNLEHSSKVYNDLIECVLKSNHKVLLDIMQVLKTFLDLQKTVQRFCDELLLRNSNGNLNVIEICECIERFVDCKHQKEAEKFWIGISDNEKSINEKNIKIIYKILPKLKISRRLVIGILEQSIGNVWWNIDSVSVAEILTALVQCNCSPFRTMQAFARWLNTNIHAVNENNLEIIVKCFTKLNFSNTQIEKALERYIKAKVLKVKSPNLIVAILEHCTHFRLRNYHILNGSSEYFISNKKNIEAVHMKSIVTPFGYLDFQPLNSIKFWQVVETYIKDNFSKFQPQDILEIFLHCCYIEMYPLNFVSSIFNPYFLDQMHSTTSENMLPKIRSDLKLLDATFTLECNNYSGPMLPRDHSAKSIWQDGRIKRIANSIDDVVEQIAGGPDNYTKSVIIGKLPVNSLYVIDILIHPTGIKNFWSFSIRSDRNVYVAVLILLPEHYNSTGEFLIGPQVMRIRHLRKLGLKVVTLDFNKLAKLRMHPKQCHLYLVERVKQALPATSLE